MQKTIGIGEYLISRDVNDSLKTYALSSCVALIAYSPLKKILGMAHIVLPHSVSDRSAPMPGYYADTAVPLLINRLCENYGCSKGELVFHLYGGAKSIKEKDCFNIGDRNIKAIKTLLALYNVNYNAAETGGTSSRTIEVDVETGNVKIEYNRIII